MAPATLGRMPLPPPDPSSVGRSANNPAKIMLNSPLAAATRARVYWQRTRQRPRERGLRVIAMISALAVHVFFLLAFVLGSGYEPSTPPESKEQLMQVRLIEQTEPPPPPPVHGTPPKEIGPRHQGSSNQPTPSSQRYASTQAIVSAQPTPVAAPPVVAEAAKNHASAVKPVAAPAPPVSLPKPAPTPELQPVPLAGEPPTVTLPTPALQPPVPPKFQPQSVRKPQLEGTQPLPPPASLALPTLPPSAMPQITVSSIALNADVPKTIAPASVTPARAELPAAPPVPELQVIPLPAQPSPSVNLQTTLSTPTPTVPREQPQVQAPKVEMAETELETVPLTPAPPSRTEAKAPAVKVTVADTALTPATQPSIERPPLSTPPATATTPAQQLAQQPAVPSKSAESSSPATTGQPATHATAPNQAEVGNEHDISTAPDASPQGSDTATPGEPNGVVAAPESTGKNTAVAQPKAGQGSSKGNSGKQQGAGQLGGNQPGAEQGEKQGALGGYVQLKPQGDTEIMDHGTRGIGYKPTRFEQNWTPAGESSIDTALRHAVEKTAVNHTFHLPRGLRIECTVTPLLPMALFGCKNPDPPPKPVDQKVYDRLNLAPAKPLVPPAPAASSAAPATMIKFDNAAECSAARVAGLPPPPGCEAILLPVKPTHAPASSSSSWVPASDQFH